MSSNGRSTTGTTRMEIRAYFANSRFTCDMLATLAQFVVLGRDLPRSTSLN